MEKQFAIVGVDADSEKLYIEAKFDTYKEVKEYGDEYAGKYDFIIERKVKSRGEMKNYLNKKAIKLTNYSKEWGEHNE